MTRTWWICKGSITKYGQLRNCRQKLMAYDGDAATLTSLKKVIEIRCPRCKTMNGGEDWPETV